VPLETVAHLERPDSPDLQVLLVRRVRWASRDNRVIKGLLDRQDSKDQRVSRASLVRLDKLDPVDK